jgi:hypothetical protein
MMASVTKILRKSCGEKASGSPEASIRPVAASALMSRLRIAFGVCARVSLPMFRWNSSGMGGFQTRSRTSYETMSGTAPPGPRTRLMIADKTSASSGDTRSSLSVSVLLGATCSSGTSSPFEGSRYSVML